MPRPPKSRAIQSGPRATYYKPRGVPARMLETVTLGLDELEAIRLADAEGLYHADAAARMNISRPTFGRLVAEARRKVAEALLHGKALMFEGGTVYMSASSWFECGGCGQRWHLPSQSTFPNACTSCGSGEVYVAPEEIRGGHGRGRGGRGHRGGRA